MDIYDLAEHLEADLKELGFDYTIQQLKHPSLVIWKSKSEKGKMIVEAREINMILKQWMKNGAFIDHELPLNKKAWVDLYMLLRKIFGDEFEKEGENENVSKD